MILKKKEKKKVEHFTAQLNNFHHQLIFPRISKFLTAQLILLHTPLTLHEAKHVEVLILTVFG